MFSLNIQSTKNKVYVLSSVVVPVLVQVGFKDAALSSNRKNIVPIPTNMV